MFNFLLDLMFSSASSRCRFYFIIFFAYLKQYKYKFNHSFQQLQTIVFIVQNNFGRLFSCKIFITIIVHSPQVQNYSWQSEFVVVIIVRNPKKEHNNYKVWSMFPCQFHTTFFIQNWTYKKFVVLKVKIRNENIKKLWFPIPKKLWTSYCLHVPTSIAL